MRFDINLATRPYLDQRLVNRIGYALIALLVLAGGWNILRATWNFGELRRLTTDIAQMEGRLDKRPAGLSEKDLARQQERIRLYNGIISRKSYSWLALLDRVESVTPDGIAIVQLAPDLKKGELRIQGNARSFTQVRSYMERLEESKDFSSVLLVSHRDITAGTAAHGVQFSISARTVLP